MKQILELLRNPIALAGFIFTVVVVTKLIGAIVSSFWYAIRRNVWGPVETAKLPAAARFVQGCVEGILNLPGILRAWFPPNGSAPQEAPVSAPPVDPATSTPASPTPAGVTGGNP